MTLRHIARFWVCVAFRHFVRMSVCTHSIHVFLGRPLGLRPATSVSRTFRGHVVGSIRCRWPYQRSLFQLNTSSMLSRLSLLLKSDEETRSASFDEHIHRTIIISFRWIRVTSSFVTGQVLLAYNITLRTHASYAWPLDFNEIPLQVSIGRSSRNFAHADLIRAVVAL